MNIRAILPRQLLSQHVSTAGSTSTSGQRPHVVGSTPQGHTDSVAQLRRHRLAMAALVLAMILFLALIPTWSFPGLAARVLVLGVVVCCHVLLRSRRSLSVGQIRAIEWTVVA